MQFNTLDLFSHQHTVGEGIICLCLGGWRTERSEGWGTDGAPVTAVFWGSSMQQMCESRADVKDSACVRGGGLISAHVWSLSAHMCRWTVCLGINISAQTRTMEMQSSTKL